MSEKQMTRLLTDRFTRAVDYAREIHVGTRKGCGVPYIAHLLGVASLVLGESGHVPFPITEDMAIAALLHDAVEDEGGMPRLHDIESKFGTDVAKIVEGCSDSFEQDASKKRPWEERKAEYVARLPNEPPPTLLVSLADKLYNARTILEDYRDIGPEVWKRFNRGREQQLWYYGALLRIFDEKCRGWRILAELQRVTDELTQSSKREFRGQTA
jgi:(p)ppGpp synthase/HD superfamily hydrolase